MADRVKPYRSSVKYWLLTTDPEDYDYDDLDADGSTVWDGITDYADLKNLRDMDEGDLALIFETGDEPEVVGIARIASDPYPDPNQEDATLHVVDVEPEDWLEEPVRLADFQNDPAFQELDLVNQPERSVINVPEPLWNRLLEMGRVPAEERV